MRKNSSAGQKQKKGVLHTKNLALNWNQRNLSLTSTELWIHRGNSGKRIINLQDPNITVTGLKNSRLQLNLKNGKMVVEFSSNELRDHWIELVREVIRHNCEKMNAGEDSETEEKINTLTAENHEDTFNSVPPLNRETYINPPTIKPCASSKPYFDDNLSSEDVLPELSHHIPSNVSITNPFLPQAQKERLHSEDGATENPPRPARVRFIDEAELIDDIDSSLRTVVETKSLIRTDSHSFMIDLPSSMLDDNIDYGSVLDNELLALVPLSSSPKLSPFLDLENPMIQKPATNATSSITE